MSNLHNFVRGIYAALRVQQHKELDMTPYIGTKMINAARMTRLAYNQLRGWELPADENGADEGYLVEYPDSAGNHPDYAGYISWSPKEQFEAAYKINGKLPFSSALVALKAGKQIAREGWNGTNMFVFLVPGSEFKVSRPPLLGIYPEGTDIKYRAHMDIKTADGSIATWAPSNSDVLAEDWYVID